MSKPIKLILKSFQFGKKLRVKYENSAIKRISEWHKLKSDNKWAGALV